MTNWRVGRRNPHTVYRQHGDEPRGYEHDEHDDSLGYFRRPADAALAVRAVNAARERLKEPAADVWRRATRYAGSRTEVRGTEAKLALVEAWLDGYRDAAGQTAPAPDPVILASHADHPLAEQVQAVLDEESVEGVADAIRRVARGEGTS